ncbi:MAG: VWA domain-containing protein [Deltaproteobacteria bacterium]|nr:VWA domain-containing protein [Deltaproteobacteria bacterium]
MDGRFVGDEALEAFLTVEHDTLPRDGGETRVTVRVRGAGPTEARAPVDVHLILDRSSSMQSSWSEAVDAAKLLVAGLAATDRIHIVAYGTRGEEVLPPRVVGDGDLARRALDRIRVGGGTNIEAGLEIAYREVRRAPSTFRGRSLVILVSDGVPNEGELGAEGLAAMAGSARTGRACRTTVIGLGDQFDADVLGAIAAEGRGGYYLARNAAELAPALTAELQAHASVAARDVELSLDFGAGAEVVHVFDGHAGTTTSDGRVVLSVPKLAAGEERRIVVRLQVAAGADPRILTSARVSYRAGGARRSASGESWMAFGASAQIAAGAGGWHAVEADLGEALAYAGRQVRYGNGEEAAARLRAHVRLAGRHPGHQSAAPLGHRTTAVGRLATALTALTPSATYAERRQVGLSLGALSVRFAR